ncbi:alpha/beta hydrolase [Pseudoduganella eburnea]|uniref:Acyl-CoA:diacylglycerol acyltransferase n=1 Tax=Massilia eburnea TaxID=1776165 RepID=A0A6L6QS82_9BURK|nr:alpha/beta hydrolase-fold protein [Massilia eburnea]MTW14496.1 alpha/beta hydrolase [Massilia eburnea]
MASRRQVLGLAAAAFGAAVARAGEPAAGAAATPGASPAAPLAIGETFTLESKVMGETRRINVYSARAWDVKPDAPLPVLFMLDGGVAEDFVHTAGLLQISVASLAMRSFMLVGIENTQRRRDMTPPTDDPEDKKIAPAVGEAATFRRFIREELMPLVKERYKTTGETALIGESLAGLFVLETFLQAPEMFDTFIAIDPTIWWNKRHIVKTAADTLRSRKRLDKTLFIATSGEKGQPELAGQLEGALSAVKVEGLQWKMVQMLDESHMTIGHPAAMRAFRTVFKPAV